MRVVKDILTIKGGDVKTVDESDTVYSAAEAMESNGIGALVVTKNGTLTGIVSERDCVCKLTLLRKSADDTLVSDIMTRKVLVVKEGTPINECMALMSAKHLRHLPVMQGKVLKGIISIGDVVKEVIRQQDLEIQQLQGYIYS
ncbi:MAG: CBS domain-containing protein [Saprospiraceae bacterium]|jgi:CBS domain-containing protein